MRLKLILVGIASTLFGLWGISITLNALSFCSILRSENLHEFVAAQNCEFQLFFAGSYGIVLVIGVILIIFGIKKRFSKSTNNLNQESHS